MRRYAVTTERMWELYQTGMSAAEVARIVGVSTPTVKQRFRVAGLKMRPLTLRTDRWYENVARAKTKNGTWSKSGTEDRFYATLLSWGLRPVRNHQVGRFAIDFAWPDRKVGIEVDSLRHDAPEVRARDSLRDAHLRRQGWRLYRCRVINTLGTGIRLLRPAVVTLGLATTHANHRGHETIIRPV